MNLCNATLQYFLNGTVLFFMRQKREIMGFLLYQTTYRSSRLVFTTSVEMSHSDILEELYKTRYGFLNSAMTALTFRQPYISGHQDAHSRFSKGICYIFSLFLLRWTQTAWSESISQRDVEHSVIILICCPAESFIVLFIEYQSWAVYCPFKSRNAQYLSPFGFRFAEIYDL